MCVRCSLLIVLYLVTLFLSFALLLCICVFRSVFFCFLYRGDFSPVQLFFVAIGVKLEHGHCVDEAVLCVYVFFSTSNIIVACFSLNLNGFLHLDKWKTFLFPWYGTRASTYCSCYSYLILSHFSFCEFPLCCNSMYGSSTSTSTKKKLSKKEMVQNEIKGFTTNNNCMLCIWYVHQLWAPNTKRKKDKLWHNTIFALCSYQIEINFQTNKTLGEVYRLSSLVLTFTLFVNSWCSHVSR